MDPEILLGPDPTAEEKIVFLAYLFSSISVERLSRFAKYGVRLWPPDDMEDFMDQTFLNIEETFPGRLERQNAYDLLKLQSQQIWRIVVDAAEKAK